MGDLEHYEGTRGFVGRPGALWEDSGLRGGTRSFVGPGALWRYSGIFVGIRGFVGGGTRGFVKVPGASWRYSEIFRGTLGFVGTRSLVVGPRFS